MENNEMKSFEQLKEQKSSRRVKSKRSIITVFAVLMLFGITLGYSVIQSQLSINGTSNISPTTWNVKFANVVVDTANSNVTATSAAALNTAKDTVSFTVPLAKPGDKYTFSVDVENRGTIDAMLNTITNSTLTAAQQKYLEYTAVYKTAGTQNGTTTAITAKDKLSTSKKVTVVITLRFKNGSEISSSADLPSSATNVTVSTTMNYVQADSTAKDRGNTVAVS